MRMRCRKIICFYAARLRCKTAINCCTAVGRARRISLAAGAARATTVAAAFYKKQLFPNKSLLIYDLLAEKCQQVACSQYIFRSVYNIYFLFYTHHMAFSSACDNLIIPRRKVRKKEIKALFFSLYAAEAAENLECRLFLVFMFLLVKTRLELPDAVLHGDNRNR